MFCFQPTSRAKFSGSLAAVSVSSPFGGDRPDPLQ